jgi:methionyl aminopeptidase
MYLESAYNPYPAFKYSGPLRPFQLSPTRSIPVAIKCPDYAVTGIPKSELERRKMAVVQPLLSETIARMRTVCKVKIFDYFSNLFV